MMATASRLYSQKVPMVFAEYLMEWMDGSNTINILVAGHTGSGKSTLINSVLGISKAPERHAIHRTKSTSLASYQNNIGDIQVTMWDSPGLGQPATDKGKAKAIEDIKKKCSDISLCLFCVDMSLARFTPECSEAMKTLSEIFGIDIWKNTLFVLTFANKYLLRIDDDFRKNPEGKKRKFESQVEVWREKLYTQLEKKLKLDPKIAKNTKLVPVGDHHSHQLFPNNNTRWLNELWLQAVSAVRHTAKPAAVKICQYLSDSINAESDPMHQCSATITLLMQENPGISPATDIAHWEFQRDDDRPQDQSLVSIHDEYRISK